MQALLFSNEAWVKPPTSTKARPVRPRSGAKPAVGIAVPLTASRANGRQRDRPEYVVRPGAAGLEAAQIVAAQEEPVDDLLTCRRAADPGSRAAASLMPQSGLPNCRSSGM